MILNKTILVLALSLAGMSAMAAPSSSFVDFSHGAQGWEGMQPWNGVGGSGIDSNMGNVMLFLYNLRVAPARALRHERTAQLKL